jgi:Rho GTPase-activating protein 11
MTSDNLVKVLTPTIMPVPLNSPQQRLNSHFKVVELLIENANLLGVVPDRMCKKENLPIAPPMTEERKKKKRRSGSLNRVFNGFRKIVGAIGSSSESLDKSHDDDLSQMTPNVSKSTKKRRLDKLDLVSFSSKKKKDLMMKLASVTEIDDVGTETQKVATPPKRRWSFGKQTRNKNPEPSQESQPVDEAYVKISKAEYETFKDRLEHDNYQQIKDLETKISKVETKISKEFNLTKLYTVKAQAGENDSMLLNGPEKVQNKYNQTLHEVEKLEESERNTEHLAKRLSRDLKIRPSVDHGVMRSPSARKIGSLRRRRDSATRLSRNQSWHLGQSSPVKQAEFNSFYPKSNLKRAKPIVVPRPLPALPLSAEKDKIIPEKPLRVKRESSDCFVTPMKMKTIVEPKESWTPATDFFKDEILKPSETVDDSMFFKTPVRPRRLSMAKTPMLPPRITPSRRFTPGSNVGTPLSMQSTMVTPSMNDSSQGRESIIVLRNQNAGMVAQKAKLFNGMSDTINTAPIKIPRAIINKNLENVKSMESPKRVRNNVSSNLSPRRSSPRSPGGIKNRSQFKAITQSPLLKTIRESQKAKLLNSALLSEVASPKRKPLSQTNTPRKTTTSGKKRRPTPSKSPRFVRRIQSNDSG